MVWSKALWSADCGLHPCLSDRRHPTNRSLNVLREYIPIQVVQPKSKVVRHLNERPAGYIVRMSDPVRIYTASGS